MQAATVIIREMAVDRVRPGELFNIARRESFIGLIMGILCGMTGSLVAYIFMQINDVAIGPLSVEGLSFIVFLSVANAMTFSSFFGAAIPQILNKAGFDPAVAAGPFVTTLNDIISSVIYFLTAYALIAWVL